MAVRPYTMALGTGCYPDNAMDMIWHNYEFVLMEVDFLVNFRRLKPFPGCGCSIN